MLTINQSKKYVFLWVLLGVLISIFCIFIYRIYSANMQDLSLEKYIVSNKQRLAVGVMLAAIVLTLYGLLKFKSIYLIVLLIGSAFIFLFPYFGGMDELYHYAFVDYLGRNFTIPLVTEYVSNDAFALTQHLYPNPSPTDPSTLGVSGMIYEAFQPPLYYIIAAMVYNLAFGNLILSVYLIKYLGLILLLITIYFTKRIYDLLVEKKVISINEFVLFSVVLLFTVSPGFLLRMVTVSNVNLLPALGSILFYYLLNLSYEREIKYKYHVIILSLLNAALVLTQFTAIYFIPLTFLFLIMKKDIKNAFKFAVTTAVLLIPWLLFNYINYGALTANTIVKDMQQSGVNPNFDTYGLWYVLENIPRMFAFFWLPQEGGYPDQPFMLMYDFLTGLLFVIIACAINQFVKAVISSRKIDLFSAYCLAAVCGNVAIVVFITVSQSWDVLLGRYLYMSLSAFIILFLLFIGRMKRDEMVVLSMVLLVCASVLSANFMGKVISDKPIERTVSAEITQTK